MIRCANVAATDKSIWQISVRGNNSDQREVIEEASNGIVVRVPYLVGVEESVDNDLIALPEVRGPLLVAGEGEGDLFAHNGWSVEVKKAVIDHGKCGTP